MGEIEVTGVVLNQQNQMGYAALLVFNGKITTTDRLDAPGDGAGIKLDQTEEVQIVGDGHRRHVHGCHRGHQGIDGHNAIGDRILRVQPEVDELAGWGRIRHGVRESRISGLQ